MASSRVSAGDGRLAPAEMPEELHPRHLRARLIQLSALLALVVGAIWLAPGLGELRTRVTQLSPGWLALGAAMQLLSTVSYVVTFRAVFCPRMSWRTSYEIGMAEQAANSVLPAGGAGGLALGAWALRRGGTSVDHIARRTVAFFLLTSLANVSTLILFAGGFAVGLLGDDAAPAVTFGFAAAGLVAIVIALALPALAARAKADRRQPAAPAGRVRRIARRGIDTVSAGVSDAVALLRQRQLGVVTGSLGYMAFDIAALAACFGALGHAPSVGVLVVAYLVGQLGGLLPIPGGIGGVEGGLIGCFALYHVPLATATAAVLAYRALALSIPALLGSVAFVKLRETLRRGEEPAAICQPLAEPIELAQLR
jgi:uncharacterized protein (TIRG00374 family)